MTVTCYLHNKHYSTKEEGTILSYLSLDLESLPRIGDTIEVEGSDRVWTFKVIQVVHRVANPKYNSEIGITEQAKVCWINLVLDTDMDREWFEGSVWKDY